METPLVQNFPEIVSSEILQNCHSLRIVGILDFLAFVATLIFFRTYFVIQNYKATFVGPNEGKFYNEPILYG